MVVDVMVAIKVRLEVGESLAGAPAQTQEELEVLAVVQVVVAWVGGKGAATVGALT